MEKPNAEYWNISRNLKIAKIIPVYKKEDDTLFTKDRPISLLTTISKIFEKLFLSSYIIFTWTRNYCIMLNMGLEQIIPQNMLL